MEDSSTDRLETFSDGVLAIAATLLVLEFVVTKGDPGTLDDQLLDLWPAYLAYTTSFLTIGIIWINHHHVMETIARVDRNFLFLNTLLLLVVAFIPFPTKLVADYLDEAAADERTAVYAYGATLFVMAVVFNVLWTYARWNRRLIRDEFPDAKIRAVTQASLIGVPLTASVLVLATWTPVGGVIFAFAISAFYLPGVMLFDRITE